MQLEQWVEAHDGLDLREVHEMLQSSTRVIHPIPNKERKGGVKMNINLKL